MAITTNLPSLALDQLGAGQTAEDLGTAGQILRSGGASGNITWVDAAENIIDFSEIHTDSAAITFSTDNGLTDAGDISTSNLWIIGDSGNTGIHAVNGALAVTGALSGNNLSGTNTGDQSIVLSGDITGSGTEAITTTLSNSAVSNVNVAAAAAIDFSKLATLDSGNILVGNSSTVAASVAVTGDISMSNAGVVAISDSSIVNLDVSSGAAIAFSKLAALDSGNILVGNSSTVAVSVAVTGDISMSNAGVTAISDSSIVNLDVNSSAAIAGTKISPNFGSQNIVTTGALTIDGVASLGVNNFTGTHIVRSANLALETATDADVFVIGRSLASTGSTRVIGDDTDFPTAGGILEVYGSSHASLANTVQIKHGTTVKISTNATGIGFFATAPTALSTGWAITNLNSDKILDADSTTVDELADVVGTIMTELLAKGLIGA